MTQQQTERQWNSLAFLRLGAFGFGISGFFMAMDTIILPVLVLGIAPAGAKNTLLGLLGLGGLVVAALVQPFVGWVSDRTRSPLGRRVPYMLWGCLIVCLGLIGLGVTTRYPSLGLVELGLATNYLPLLLLWLVIQANASIGFGPFQALIRDLVPVSRFGVASSFKILADVAGGVILIAVAGALLGFYTGPESIRWLWIALAVLGITLVVTAVISSFIVVPRERAARRESQDIWSQLRSTARLHPQLGWFLLSRYFTFAAVFVFPTYGLFFLGDVVGVENPAQTLGIMILPIGGALALSIYPAGWLSDRIGRKPVVVAGAIGAAISTVAMVRADSPLETLVIASVIAAFVGVVLSASWALANELGPIGREGQHIGLVSVATLGGAASAKVLGPGVDLLNLAAPGAGYTALLAGSGLFLLLGALLLIPVKAQVHGPPQEPA